jgi:hypothetical protein
MPPSTRHFVALISIGCCLAFVGCGGAAQSPDDVYQAATAAAQKNDYRTYAKYLTPASLDQLASGLLSSAEAADADRKARKSGGRPELDADEQKQWEKVQKVIEKHKIDLAALDADPATADSADVKDVIRGMLNRRKQVIDQIEDKAGFVHDMMQAYRVPQDDETKAAPESKLTDVKIDGERATAKVKFTHEGKEIVSTVNFRRIEGAWKIDQEQSGR